ncbi:uncharacterized protein LOC120357546 [Solenopsis invicta]|uniref:uncharacterized protein LOC120357546 n=1 Tax=Solenopsis invicta TaxID=13686 RepID=UPI00193CEA23|nr:uncharacterized protein LOC120357546 [Solenopsis invicta]
MEEMSVYYGLAIQRHADSIEDMRKAVWATFYHMTSTDENPQHSYCPKGPKSWCKWQQLKTVNQEASYKHPPAFDDKVAALIKPIYEDLSSEDLLERCLGANTQNNNESFNACVWNLVPKHVFTGKKY